MNIKKILLNNKNSLYEFILSDFPCESDFLNECAKIVSKSNIIILYNTSNSYDNISLQTGFKLRQLCSLYDNLFIVNSRVDFAKILNADGLCLNSQDIPADCAKKILSGENIFCAKIKNNENISDKDNFDFLISDNDITKSNSGIPVFLKYKINKNYKQYKKVNYDVTSKDKIS